MAAQFVSTPGGPGGDDIEYALEGKAHEVDDEFLAWLQKYKISPDGVDKITRNISFKRIHTLATYSRALAENAANKFKLDFDDTVGFLDGINDLKEQQQIANNQPLPPHAHSPLSSVKTDFIAKKQEVHAMKNKLQKEFIEQQQRIDGAFSEIISSIHERKRRILKTLETMHVQNQDILNMDDCTLKQLSLTEIQQYAKYTKLTFHTAHKAALMQQISSFGAVKSTEMYVPSLSMKRVTPTSVHIEMKDEDLRYATYKYEAMYCEQQQDAEHIDHESVSWQTEVIKIANQPPTCTQMFALQRLKPNQSYCVQVKKSNIVGDECVFSTMIGVYTNSVCNEHAKEQDEEQLIVYDEEEKDDEEVMHSMMATRTRERSGHSKQAQQETADGAEAEVLRWDKLRHGANVYFVNEYTVKTGEFALAVCDGGIVTDACAESKEYFIWEINVEKISKDSSWIGYLDGPIASDSGSHIAWNDCLTGGKLDHSSQFAIAFNRRSKWATLYGRGKAKAQIKLKSVAKNGDRFLFYVDFKTRAVTLYQNEHKIGIVFTKISAFIVPAVSGRLATYSIRALPDLSHIEAARHQRSSTWGWFG